MTRGRDVTGGGEICKLPTGRPQKQPNLVADKSHRHHNVPTQRKLPESMPWAKAKASSGMAASLFGGPDATVSSFCCSTRRPRLRQPHGLHNPANHNAYTTPRTTPSLQAFAVWASLEAAAVAAIWGAGFLTRRESTLRKVHRGRGAGYNILAISRRWT